MHFSAVATQTWVMLQTEFMSWISEYDYSYLNWLQPSYKIPAMYEQPAFSVMVTCTQISSKLPYMWFDQSHLYSQSHSWDLQSISSRCKQLASIHTCMHVTICIVNTVHALLWCSHACSTHSQ